MNLPAILEWDEEAPPAPSQGDWPMSYEAWEEKRLEKRDAAIALLRPATQAAASHEAEAPSKADEEISEDVIAEFWPT